LAWAGSPLWGSTAPPQAPLRVNDCYLLGQEDRTHGARAQTADNAKTAGELTGKLRFGFGGLGGGRSAIARTELNLRSKGPSMSQWINDSMSQLRKSWPTPVNILSLDNTPPLW